MFRVKLLKSFSKFLITLLENGQILEKLILLEMGIKENDFITLIQYLPQAILSLKLLIRNERFVIVESVQSIKKMIYKDKKNLCEKNILMLILSKILVLVLIGNVKAYSPLYSKSKMVKWNELLLLTKIDFVDLLMNSSNSFSPYIKLSSWFSIQVKENKAKTLSWQKIYYQLSMFSLVKKWEKENIKEKKLEKITKSFKVEIKPNKFQQIKLNKYINDTIYTYNKGVELINNEKYYNFQDLRNEIVTKTNKEDYLIPKWLYNTIPESIYDTPKSIRAQELKVLSVNLKSAISNLKNKNIKYFKMSFKSKRKINSFIINEEKQYADIKRINNNYYLSISKLKNIKIKNTKNINKYKLEIIKDFKIQKTRLNKWYLILSFDKQIKENKTKERICALDPGFREFQRGIDLKGNQFSIGENLITKFNKHRSKIFKTQSYLDLLKQNKFKSYKKYKLFTRTKYNYYFLIQKQKHYIHELHYQTCNYLTQYYDKIIIPVFNTKQMVKSGNKFWNKMISCFNHFQFRERLINKATELNKKIIVVTEHFTSKTCSNCYNYNYLLGNSKYFKCNNCNKEFDRDGNAAYNILKNVLLGNLKILS